MTFSLYLFFAYTVYPGFFTQFLSLTPFFLVENGIKYLHITK